MSARTVSTLTLAVAMLLGVVVMTTAQELPAGTAFQPAGPIVVLKQTKVAPEPPVPVMSPTLPGAVPALGPTAPVMKGANDHRQMFTFYVGLFGAQPCPLDMTCGSGPYRAPEPGRLLTAPVPPRRPNLQAFIGYFPDMVPASDVVPSVEPTGTLGKCAAGPLAGTWFREVPGLGVQVVATFAHDELKLCVTQSADGHVATLTVTAHYTVTADGLVYGAVTGADVDLKGDPKADGPNEELAELAMVAQALVDAPFSCRTKATSAGLMVSGVKCGLKMGRDESEQLQIAFGGLFKCAKDGKVPAPKQASVKTRATGGKCDCGFDPSDYQIFGPKGQPVERVGVDFNFNQTLMYPPVPPGLCQPAPLVVYPPPPVQGVPFGPPVLSKIPYVNQLFQNVGPATPPPVPQPVRPANPWAPEDATKQLAEDAFGQLLQQSGVVRPTGGMTLPSPKYLEHYPQYIAPEPAGGVRPVGAPAPAMPAPVKAAIGTWYRDVAGKQCVVKVTHDHLTLTVHDAQEVDGKVSTASLVITADYHLTRDGITAVGLITSVDVSFEGDFPAEDSKPFFEMLGELQKVLEDKPFALTFRTYGEALVIGNVRMPQVSERMEVQPAGYMAGRYKAAGDKIPKPKPVKMPPEPRASNASGGPLMNGPAPTPYGLPLPAGAAPSPYGVPLPSSNGDLLPPLPSSNGDLLPPQRIPPAQAPRIIPSGGEDSWAPPMPQPTKPPPQMAQPVPPGEVRPVNASAEPSKNTKYAADPNERIKELLYQSDTSGPIGETARPSLWQRFWFNDQPRHLTPERIHGGIY